MALTKQEIEAALAEVPEADAHALRSSLTDPAFDGQIRGFPEERAAHLLALAECFARAPISGFHVGAVAVGKSGALYLGANLEFQGVPLHASLHAEQSAVLNAWMHDESEVTALHVSALPCGHCRQFLRELSNCEKLTIHAEGQTHRLEALLPHAFGKTRKQGHGLLDSTPTPLESVKPEPDTSALRAINAAQRSYAPYSLSPEGFVIECLNGRFFAGRAAESAAFNPSVPSILLALNQRNLSASREVSISACTQSKLATAMNNPLPLAKAILSSLSESKIEVVQMEVKAY